MSLFVSFFSLFFRFFSRFFFRFFLVSEIYYGVCVSARETFGCYKTREIRNFIQPSVTKLGVWETFCCSDVLWLCFSLFFRFVFKELLMECFQAVNSDNASMCLQSATTTTTALRKFDNLAEHVLQHLRYVGSRLSVLSSAYCIVNPSWEVKNMTLNKLVVVLVADCKHILAFASLVALDTITNEWCC